MKKYIVHDRQLAGFMGWTHETPQTKQQLKSYLYAIANDGKTSDDDKWEWRTTTLDDFLEMWELSIEAV